MAVDSGVDYGYWLFRQAQIVQQDIEAGVEQACPTTPQKGEKRPLLPEQLVKAAVQGVGGDGRHRITQQVAHRRVPVPMPVQPPYAARIDQPITHPRLQHVQPARALAARLQPGVPELVQVQPVNPYDCTIGSYGSSLEG